MPTIVALDLESTGLLKPDIDGWLGQPGIMEIGAIKAEIDGDTEDYESGHWTAFGGLVNPEMQIEEAAQKITGIDEEQVKNEPTFREIFTDFAKFMVGSDILVTFNGKTFDLPLLQHQLKRYNLETRFPWCPFHVDLMESATQILGMSGRQGNKPPKLNELHLHLFDTEIEGHHRAVEDAKATIWCYLSLVKQKKLWIPG